MRGTLVVSAWLTFGSVFVIPRLTQLTRRYPQLVVDLRLDDRLIDLVAEGADLAIRAGSEPPDRTAIVARPLLTMQRVLVASARWLRKNGAPREPRQLARANCLIQVTPAGSVIGWQLQRGDHVETPEVLGSLRSNAPIALRDLALAGAGIAYLPDFLVAADLADGRLRRVLPEWSSAPITAWAVHRTELRGTPRIRAFLAAMRS